MVVVSMEAGRACHRDDADVRLQALSLGISSVRLIVNKFEAQYGRITNDTPNRELVKYDPNIDSGYEDYDDFPLDHSRRRVWARFANALHFALSRCIPSVTFGNFGALAVASGLFAPRMISYLVLYPFCRLVFGTLYPAYASYKAVRTKNLKEYVKWMMYWIVFALFTCTETFTDVFLSWFPFYYEVKIVLVLWLLSPATKGSSILYRKFVHPALCRREQEIDEYIAKAKDQGYHTVLNLGTKGVNYATTVIMQTAIKGGGGLVQQIRKSYSLSDLSECDPRDERGTDEADDVMTEPRLIRRTTKGGYATRRSASESNNRSQMYFPEVDVDVRPRPRSDGPDFSHIKSTEDISSGYSSADNSASLTRTASLGASARARAKTTRTAVTTIKRPQAAEGEVIIEEIQEEDGFEYANMPPLLVPSNASPPIHLSHSDPPFLYQYVGDQIKIIQVLGNYPLERIIHNNDTNPNDSEKVTEINPNIVKSNIDTTESKQNEMGTIESVKDNILTEVNVTTEKQNTELDTRIETPKESTEILKETEKVSETNETIQNETIETSSKKIVNENTITPKENGTNVGEEALKLDTLVDPNIMSNDADTSIKDNDSAESDDEASFGTPDNSPKSKKKNIKGKYGKTKAPPPPTFETECLESKNDKNKVDLNVTEESTSQESLVEIVNSLPNVPFKESGNFKGLQVINPISEIKRRHKSKSPARIPKGNSSGISKLLQLPSKLAFWNKNEDKTKSDASTSSGDRSRRSSNNIEQVVIDEFQSCADLSTIVPNITEILPAEKISHEIVDDDNNFIDAVDLENEDISHEIIEKSDALQKLIEAKLESHPEYKIVSLHEEISTTSKSTDV